MCPFDDNLIVKEIHCGRTVPRLKRALAPRIDFAGPVTAHYALFDAGAVVAALVRDLHSARLRWFSLGFLAHSSLLPRPGCLLIVSFLLTPTCGWWRNVAPSTRSPHGSARPTKGARTTLNGGSRLGGFSISGDSVIDVGRHGIVAPEGAAGTHSYPPPLAPDWVISQIGTSAALNALSRQPYSSAGKLLRSDEAGKYLTTRQKQSGQSEASPGGQRLSSAAIPDYLIGEFNGGCTAAHSCREQSFHLSRSHDE